MMASKNTTRWPATGRVAPNFQGAIGVKSTGQDTEPEGVDVVVPVLKLTATFVMRKNTIDLDYVRVMAGLAGRTNDDVFLWLRSRRAVVLGLCG